MRRRLFAVASAVSLLLLVSAGLLWVRSYWRQDTVYHVGQNWSTISVCSHCGQLSELGVLVGWATRPMSGISVRGVRTQFRWASRTTFFLDSQRAVLVGR